MIALIAATATLGPLRVVVLVGATAGVGATTTLGPLRVVVLVGATAGVGAAEVITDPASAITSVRVDARVVVTFSAVVATSTLAITRASVAIIVAVIVVVVVIVTREQILRADEPGLNLLK